MEKLIRWAIKRYLPEFHLQRYPKKKCTAEEIKRQAQAEQATMGALMGAYKGYDVLGAVGRGVLRGVL